MVRRGRPSARDKQLEPPATARGTPDAAARHAREATQARAARVSERTAPKEPRANRAQLVPPPARARGARFAPPPATESRATGISSFLRLPIADKPALVAGVDVLLCGVPFDGASAFRPGARFGPRAVREASAFASSFSSALGVDVFRELGAADGGDVTSASAAVPAVLEAVAASTQMVAGSGVIPGFVGGDRTLTLGALRGLKRSKHRACGLLLIAAHPGASGAGSTISASNFLRYAVEEGLVRTDCTMQVGLRGPYQAPDELSFAFSHGIDTVGVDEVRWDLHAVVSQVRKLVQKGALYVSVDLGALDPAHAPGASFPVPGGMTTWDLQQLLRALVGAEVTGFDVVELAPDYDPTGISALAGVAVLHEILAAMADTRRSAGPAPSTHRSGRAGRRSA
jgi:arginase family enzyme